MNYTEFFAFFAEHAVVVLTYIILATAFLFFTIRKVAIAGILDPIHMSWTFTFGTTYGLVLSFLHYQLISLRIFIFIAIYLLIFLISINYFYKKRYKGLSNNFLAIMAANRSVKLKIKISLTILVILITVLLLQVGLNAFTTTNRFDSNRGFGPVVVYAKIISIFIISFFTIKLLAQFQHGIYKVKFLAVIFILIAVCGFFTLLFGAKAEFLGYLYAMFVVASLYFGKVKRPLFIGLLGLGIALPFAFLILILNLEAQGIAAFESGDLVRSVPMFLQRFFQRVLSNGDQVYLGLPYGVIDQLKTDSLSMRFASSLFGNTFMSNLFGYDVSQFNVGRQALLYHYPGVVIAGGPTSHFDLFAYKYMGEFFGYFFALISAIILGFISSLASLCRGNMYRSAVVTTLWISALSLLLAPPVGIAHLIQAIAFFLILEVIFSSLTIKKYNLVREI